MMILVVTGPMGLAVVAVLFLVFYRAEFWGVILALQAASSLPDHPDVWTDGSLVLDRLTGVSSSGAGFFAHQAGRFRRGCLWGQVDDVRSDLSHGCCRGFCSVLGPLQSVQRAELWGVILALQTSRAVHLGVDNLGVVRHVGRLLDGNVDSIPAELVKDGDLLLLIGRMLRLGELDTVRITKVKGLADESMVGEGGVRELDRIGNDAADKVAGGLISRLLMLAATLLEFVVGGARFFWRCTAFLLPFRELWSIMWMEMVLRLILWSGLLVLFRRDVGWCMLCVIVLFCLGQRAFGRE